MGKIFNTFLTASDLVWQVVVYLFGW